MAKSRSGVRVSPESRNGPSGPPRRRGGAHGRRGPARPWVEHHPGPIQTRHAADAGRPGAGRAL
jgi:hypothetical protein